MYTNEPKTVQVYLMEYDGPNEWGWHDFLQLPRIGETISVLHRDLFLGKVRDIKHTAHDFEKNNHGYITLYIQKL